MALDFTKAQATTMESGVSNFSITSMATDGVTGQEDQIYTNEKWTEHWGYFNQHPELKAAILMKAVWNVGKGWTADTLTTAALERITGYGKDTFDDILFNMEVCRRVGRDAFAEIIRNDKGTLLNLKVLDPGSMRIIFDESGIIKRYEQFNKGKTKIFKPEEIFHLSNNRIADQVHGISDIESLDKTILAELESFNDTKKIMHRQAKPFIVFKLKTDDPAKITSFSNKINAIRDKCEDLIIPDDENILSFEVVQVNVSQIILEWRNQVIQRFYRALGLPLVIFGAAGSTESGSKMEYFAHEQVFEHDQRYIEKQIWNQLKVRINLIPPQSMASELQTDESKDANQGLEMQQSDMTAGRGR